MFNSRYIIVISSRNKPRGYAYEKFMVPSSNKYVHPDTDLLDSSSSRVSSIWFFWISNHTGVDARGIISTLKSFPVHEGPLRKPTAPRNREYVVLYTVEGLRV